MSICKITSYNPANPSQVIAEYEVEPVLRIPEKIEESRRAGFAWSTVSVSERVSKLSELLNLLKSSELQLAQCISLEMGKPINQSIQEVRDSIDEAGFLLSRAEEVLSETHIGYDSSSHHYRSWVALGVVAVIAPWNYPLELSLWGILGALLAGNGVIYKPSEQSPLVGQTLFDLLFQLDIPPGLIQIVHGDRTQGIALVEASVDCIWFVGSTEAGLDIYQRASRSLKKCLLEMGGSSPGIILEGTAITENLVREILASRLTNTGQVCSAIKRLFVHESLHDQIIEYLGHFLSEWIPADPLDLNTNIGPVATKVGLLRLKEAIYDAKSKGASHFSVECVLPEDGFYFPPTIITGATRSMKVMAQEIFGPLLPVVKFCTTNEAIHLANDTNYGLSAVIYGSESDQLKYLASKIEAGRVCLNSAKGTDIKYSFECFKDSGLGCCQGDALLSEFALMKYTRLHISQRG